MTAAKATRFFFVACLSQFLAASPALAQDAFHFVDPGSWEINDLYSTCRGWGVFAPGSAATPGAEGNDVTTVW